MLYLLVRFTNTTCNATTLGLNSVVKDHGIFVPSPKWDENGISRFSPDNSSKDRDDTGSQILYSALVDRKDYPKLCSFAEHGQR
ncbi:hypothetical protein AFLA_010812 [Aspergillus flavus NRRL3357]|nr:hypothetical protein AFLA_010812 [Aspergillus flavus NRRL3357]